jgi:DNA-binding transcriptional ArsR family regulator
LDIKTSVKAFSALAQDTRLEIVRLLEEHNSEGLCPCNILEKIDLTNANLSFHLKELENAGLVRKEKKGKFVHYYAECEFIRELGNFLLGKCEFTKTKSK